MFNKNYALPNGATAATHRVREIQIVGDMTVANVNISSYASEAAYLDGSHLMATTPVAVPLGDIGGAILAGVEDWLITNSASPFNGGYVIQDRKDSLEAVRNRAWAAIKAARSAAEEGGFTFEGGSYQADKVRINGAVQLAILAKLNETEFSETWTLTDNTTRRLSADQVIALGRALGEYVSHLYATGRALRAQIEAAATIEEVRAVAWPAPNAEVT